MYIRSLLALFFSMVHVLLFGLSGRSFIDGDPGTGFQIFSMLLNSIFATMWGRRFLALRKAPEPPEPTDP